MKEIKLLALLSSVFLLIPNNTYAHTDLNDHAGFVTNMISLGIVLTSILIYIVLSRKRKKK